MDRYPGHCCSGTPVACGQRGAVLVFSLIFLLIFTVLGVSSMSSSILEEKMTTNSYDRTLAFQAAEAALREAEDYISNNTPTLDEQCANGFCVNARKQLLTTWRTDPGHAYWASARTIQDPIAGVASNARYIIEDMCAADSTLGAADYANRVFRVTAIGTGGSDNAVVMLESSVVMGNNYGVAGSCDCSNTNYCDGTCGDINCTP